MKAKLLWKTAKPGLLLSVLAAMALTGCGGTENDQTVVATFSHGGITHSELDEFILSQPEDRQKPSPGQDVVSWRRAHLERLLTQRALAAEAEVLDLLSDPRVTVSLESARTQALLDALEARLVIPRLDITTEDARRYYDSHPESFGHGEQIRLRHIFKRVDRRASAEVRAQVRREIEGLLEQARGGGNFGDLARDTSDSETAHLGGLIGRLDRDQLDPEIEALVWSLAEGEVSEVVSTPIGFHIFKLENRIPAYRMGFDEAAPRAREQLLADRRRQLLDEIADDAMSEGGAVLRTDLLRSSDPIQPGTVLFDLGQHTITGDDFAHRATTASFLSVRLQSPEQWLIEKARARALQWKADRLGLGELPEVVGRVEEARRRLAVEAAYGRRLRAKIDEAQADGELVAHYDSHSRRFQTPKLARLRLVVVDFDAFDRPDDGYDMLKMLRRLVIAGDRELAEAARELSTDPSASRGGDVGWIRLGAFGEWAGPRAQQMVAGLEEGELSEPLLVERYDSRNLLYERLGFALVRVEGIRWPEMLSFEEARDAVASSWAEFHQSELEAGIIAEVLDETGAEILEDRL